MKKENDVAYDDVLKDFDKVCCTKALVPLEVNP
jgi:hypothetical protein